MCTQYEQEKWVPQATVPCFGNVTGGGVSKMRHAWSPSDVGSQQAGLLGVAYGVPFDDVSLPVEKV